MTQQSVESERDQLIIKVGELEAEIAHLEAEGLQLVVDRLRSQVAAIKALVEAWPE